MARDQAIETCDPGRCENRLVVCQRCAESEVLTQRAVEQPHILGNVSEIAAQIRRIDLLQVRTVEQHRAADAFI